MASTTSRVFSAVVGTGFIGPVHIEALRRLGRPMVGVLGSSPEKSRAAADAWNIIHAYESFDHLLAEEMISVVHLTSPNREHFTQCRKALAAGKHVLCEKPLAMTSAETAELVALAERTPLVTAVNYNVRFYPLCLEVRRRILDGLIGDVHHVTGSYVQDWLLHETDFNWRVLAGEGGASRAVADIGTHWLDLVTWMTGLAVESVCADLRTVHSTRLRPPQGSVDTFQNKLERLAEARPVPITTEDYASVLLHFRGGPSGCLTVSQVTAGRKNCLRFEIAGSKAALAWNSEQPDSLWIGRRDRPSELLLRDPALLGETVRPFTSYPGGHCEGFSDTFKQLFRCVYEYIDAGDPTAPRFFPTFLDGHREVVLTEAILQSHRERRWIDVAAV